MRNEKRTNALAEGALMTALTVVLILIGFFVPPLQIIINVIWTVPIIVLVVRRDLRIGLMATVNAGLVVTVFTGPVRAVILFVQFAALGLAYGYLFKKKVQPGRIVFVGTGVSLVSLLAGLFLSAKFLNIPIGGLFGELDGAVQYTIDFYRRTGMLESLVNQGITREQLEATLSGIIDFLKLLLPGILISASIIAAFINYLVAEKILKRLQLIEEGLPPFRHWQLPWYFIWGVIIGLAFWQVGDYYGLDLASRVGINVLYIYIPLLAGNGIAAIAYVFHKYRLSLLIKIIFAFVLLINPPLVLVFIIMFGLFDPFINYRQVHTSGTKGE